jgi:hypothetical protein
VPVELQRTLERAMSYREAPAPRAVSASG